MFEKEIKLLTEILLEVKNYNDNERYLIEFKTNFVSDKDMQEVIGTNISGIANTCLAQKKEYGYIVCGIADKILDKVGVKFDPFDIKVGNEDFEMWLRPRMAGVDFDFLPFKMENKDFLIIKVGQSQGRLATFNKISYYRLGKNIKELHSCPIEIQQKLLYSIKGEAFWNRIIVENVSQVEIQKTLDFGVYYLSQQKPIPIQFDLVIKDFLDEGFLYIDDGFLGITFLGILLFGRNLYLFDSMLEHRVRVVTFTTNSNTDGYTNIFGQKGYVLGFEDIITYIIGQTKKYEIVTSAIRDKIQFFSPISIREFLANCIIHQDFLSPSNPTIEIYPDRIGFMNSGQCLVELNRIMDCVPKSRNPKLSDIMRRLGICEKLGSGIDRSVQEIEQLVLPAPKFENKSNGFIATLSSKKDYENMTEKERIDACYWHICWHWINQSKLDTGNKVIGLSTNSTIRNRFQLEDKASTVSNLIKLCIDKNIVKVFDPESESKKFRKYVPFWV